ncbi:MAG: hypothetical protein A2091_03940 [Desulfuromonadales bacterium GWD2_61_12]|nr:MAG: hypothetical protein A2005_03300 [Desulfuromonadales bacterium GWC2_61_20]OGR36015.1 MAG: hypothetical protein A2091_03940 [Desulfuromonadales bacterium GWD2_61_12]HAD05276.1 hypothetical protein [Desulfuromonas sp.]
MHAHGVSALFRNAGIGGLLFALVACAPARVERQRFFWPPGQDDAKIEYINFYQVDQDLRRDENRWLDEMIFGREEATASFKQPQAIAAAAAGRIFVSDVGLSRVLVYDMAQRKVRKLTRREGGDSLDFDRSVSGLAVTANGSILASLATGGEIGLFGPDEVLQRTFGKGQLQRPVGLAVDETRRRIYVADSGAHRLVLFDLDGEFVGYWGERGGENGRFNFPLDVDVDERGQVFVLDAMNARIQVFDAQGTFLRSFGERGTAVGSFMIPKSLAVSPQGHVYVTDSLGHKVVVFDREGQFLLAFGGRAAAVEGVQPGGFSLPEGIAVDGSSTIWVVDSFNRMFHQFQYLDAAYLAKNPILPGQAFIPPQLLPGQGSPGPAISPSDDASAR